MLIKLSLRARLVRAMIFKVFGESHSEPGFRILEHDLADPNRVGIVSPPPRQIAGVGREPIEQQSRQLGQF